MNRRTVLTALLLAAATAALYLPHLEDAPRYLVADELYSALTVHSLVTTGRDPHGAFLPLYFQMDLLKRGSPMWFQPLLIYGMSGAVKALSFSETAIRLPMAVAGVINVVLTYVAGRLLFERERFAIIAAALLATTPAHFMYSRVAMDFQAPLPFVLGWLVCVLAYVRRGRPWLLAAGGLLLGLGLYSYVAAAAFMPLYAVLTCVVLYLRREPYGRYLRLGFGFLAPASLGAFFVLTHPTMLRDVAVHYQPDGEVASGTAAGAMTTLFAPARIADAAARYSAFWNPRFLFVDGPHRYSEDWLVGVLLLPMAALLIVGIAYLLRHRERHVSLLLVAGLLTAPLPASFVDQPEAIRRALELLPFAALTAAVGLEGMKTTRSVAGRWIAFLVFWFIVLALAIAAHGHVAQAQAFVRAATVPLALAALFVLLEEFRFDTLASRDTALAAGAALVAAQLLYVIGRQPLVHITLGLGVVAAFIARRTADDRFRRLALSVVLALVASELMCDYVDYFPFRVGVIPASGILLIVRLAATTLVLAGSIAAGIGMRWLAGRMPAASVVALALALAASVPIAYFYVDLSVNPWLRAPYVGLLAAALIATAAVASAPPAGPVTDRLADLTAVGMLVIVCLQFAGFYADYFTKFQARGSGAQPGNVRIAMEAAIDLAQGRDVPAIYLARVRNESPGLGKAYADFYLLKKNRPELIERTVEGDTYSGFELESLLQLPRGSLIIVNPNGRNDAIIDRLAAAGEIRRRGRLLAPDGTAMFWILERAG